jgi:D-sedoheptulose 7-phosphate isomerase
MNNSGVVLSPVRMIFLIFAGYKLSIMESIITTIRRSIAVKQRIIEDAAFIQRIATVAEVLEQCFRNGGKVLFCGNGGSAADAQHLAAEFSGRFYYDRPPLPSEALHVNTSFLTAVANDYHFDLVFARAVRGQGKPGDVLVGLSTSGHSPNVVKAFEVAREIGMVTVALTGEGGGKMAPLADHLLDVPSGDTPRIQEAHITIGHILCEIVEQRLFPREDAV